jgi:hypothetical protein
LSRRLFKTVRSKQKPIGSSAEALRQAHVGVRVMEAANNYARADTPLYSPLEAPRNSERYHGHYYRDDGMFWDHVLHDPDSLWGVRFRFGILALSEWVARVPGLYWKDEAKQMRKLSPEAIEVQKEDWTQYTPWGKSQVVLGGVGTMRLPPGPDGTRLCSITSTINVSAGVPVLIGPEVWDEICSRRRSRPYTPEGRLLRGSGRWQPMSQTWEQRFPSTQGMPRGYLVLDDVRTFDNTSGTLIHPFTIMEYQSGAKELFDFVYAGVDTQIPGYRDRIESFFARYKDERGRNGRYLLAADMINPLWDAQYNSPAELCQYDPPAGSQLALLEARVRERMTSGEGKIEALLETLGRICPDDLHLRTISSDIGIEPALWYKRVSLAELLSVFLDEVSRRGPEKLEALIDLVMLRQDLDIA